MNMWKFVFFLLAFFATSNADTPRLDGKIVGGHEVEIEDYPHQVSLQVHGEHNCGGMIVSKDYVLTAAHCLPFQLDGDTVRAGSSYTNHSGTVHKVKYFYMHDDYNVRTTDYDFGLARVYPPFNLESKNYAVIKIADVEPPENLEVFATGWGEMMVYPWKPSKLRGVSLKIVSRKACANDYSQDIFNYYNFTDRMICAKAPGKDACQGDSGGPLIDPKTKILYGIVSWGKGCADPSYPGVYANVAHQKDWIKKHICG